MTDSELYWEALCNYSHLYGFSCTKISDLQTEGCLKLRRNYEAFFKDNDTCWWVDCSVPEKEEHESLRFLMLCLMSEIAKDKNYMDNVKGLY